MNILFTNYFGSGKGGGEISLEVLAKELNKKHNVIIASSEEFPGFKNYKFEKRKGSFEKYNKYLTGFFSEIIKKEKIDVIHGNDRLTSVAAVLAGRKIKSVLHFRDYWFVCPRSSCLTSNNKEYKACSSKIILKHYPIRRWPVEFYKLSYLKKIRPILKLADKKIAISSYVKDKLKLINIDDAEVIPNPVDIKLKRTKEKKFIISFVGELSHVKGILGIYKVMKSIAKGNVYFYIIGEGKLKNKIKETRNIKLLGKLSYNKVLEIYSKSNLVVFPSIWQEPFGRIAIESMSFGVPVIASDVGGLRDIVRDGETGFLVDPFDLGEWGKKIILLIGDKKLRARMSRNCLKESKKYNVKKIAKLVEKIYFS